MGHNTRSTAVRASRAFIFQQSLRLAQLNQIAELSHQLSSIYESEELIGFDCLPLDQEVGELILSWKSRVLAGLGELRKRVSQLGLTKSLNDSLNGYLKCAGRIEEIDLETIEVKMHPAAWRVRPPSMSRGYEQLPQMVQQIAPQVTECLRLLADAADTTKPFALLDHFQVGQDVVRQVSSIQLPDRADAFPINRHGWNAFAPLSSIDSIDASDWRERSEQIQTVMGTAGLAEEFAPKPLDPSNVFLQ